VSVAGRNELEIDQMKLLRVGGTRIVLARTESGYVAFDDRCTHKGGSLAGGVLICGTVQCLWHGSQFDASTGKVKCGPAEKDVRRYQVTEEGDQVKLRLDVAPSRREAADPTPGKR
jgi:nitrite reductase/ring-hydroxylating ferredoxin subunit